MEQVIDENELLRRSAAGDKEAFGLLIERYQTLVYALAYSATGSIEKSEELAQETFLRAWASLRQLREPARFRSWLCTIARNLAARAGRNKSHDVLAGAGSLEDTGIPAREAGPAEASIRRERQEIVWSALRRIPLKYREPLVLFYSAGRSVREVADELELSEHVVRQRLYRGRQLLNAEIASLVEDTLARVRPGQAFTATVVALLPAVATPAAGAAVLGLKGVPAAKALWASVASGALLGPLLGMLGGLLGAWCSIKNTRSPRERRFMIRMSIVMWLLVMVLIYLPLLLLLVGLMPKWAFWAFCAAFFALLGPLAMLTNARQRQIQKEDGTYQPPPCPSRPPGSGGIYGGFGGAIFGSVAWLLIMAGIVHDWPTFAAIFTSATVVFFIATQVALRRGSRLVAAWISLVGLAVLTLTVVNLRWDIWMRAYRHSSWYDPRNDISRAALDAIILGAFVVLAISQWAFLGRHRDADDPPCGDDS
jgi:RNA polymerase sigma factor (sigma-70 family)